MIARRRAAVPRPRRACGPDGVPRDTQAPSGEGRGCVMPRAPVAATPSASSSRAQRPARGRGASSTRRDPLVARYARWPGRRDLATNPFAHCAKARSEPANGTTSSAGDKRRYAISRAPPVGVAHTSNLNSEPRMWVKNRRPAKDLSRAPKLFRQPA